MIAFEAEPIAVVAKRPHPAGDGRAMDVQCRRTARDEVSNLVGELEHLEERDPAAVAGTTAGGATASAAPDTLLPGLSLGRPSATSSSFVALTISRQSGHTRRVSRCATRQVSVAARRPGSTPMSVNRRMAEAAVCEWIVEHTRWPVMAARTAICAVSSSRISPTRITSGSERRIVRARGRT